MAFTLLAALLMTAYGSYVLYDIFYTGQSAYSSYDLLQYRPAIDTDSDSTDPRAFDELREINPDTVGWIEFFGTHINYPVVQGRDDLEYLNKDIFGNFTLTGSIYLSAGNNAGFDDWYNIIFGHHMDNGAMFGDIGRYLDKDYFDTHKNGTLQTVNGTYDVKVFACVSTDSYNGTVYNTDDSAEVLYPELRAYIEAHAIQIDALPDENDDSRILGLSTCTDAATNGRVVLFASLEPHDPDNDAYAGLDGSDAGDSPADGITAFMKAIGHYSDSEHWAFLNLIAMLLTVLTLLPLLALRRKYRQLSYSRRTARELKKKADTNENIRQIYDDLRRFVRKMRIGIVLELLIAVLAVVIFLFTENITKRVVISDRYTGIMILVEAATLVTDFICFRYRGVRFREEKTIPEDNMTAAK